MSLANLSIKRQLLLIVAIIAIPASFIVLNSGIHQREDDIHDAKIITQKLAESIVSEQKNLAASTRQLFIALSQLPEVKTRNSFETQLILSEILKQSPHYSNIFIADSFGVVWASAVPLKETVSVADRRYFVNALTSGNLSSGEFHVARTSLKPTLNLGYPLRDHTGKTTDVIVVGFSLDHYRKVFDLDNLPAGASFALLDHKGIILTRAIDPEKHMGKPSNQEIFQNMLAGPDEETSIGTSSVVGDNRVQTYRKIRLEGESTPYMYVRVGIPTDVVLAKASADLARNISIYSLSLMLAIVLSWLIGKKYIIDKVNVLQSSSQRLAEGDLHVRVAGEVSGGELGELGQAFDDMAEKLELREQALRVSEKNFRDIFHTTHDALFLTDASGTIMEVNRASEKIFGYAREEFFATNMDNLMSVAPSYLFADAVLLIKKSFEEGTQKFEWRCKRNNGESFWAEVAVTPTSDLQKGQVLLVVQDITERKEIEQMKETLLSNISHEMRTPLTSILGFLDFVTENRLDEDKIRDYHITMYKEATRLNEMVTNFLDMQRLKSNLHKYVFSQIQIEQLIEDVVAIFASPAAKHTIVVDVSSGLPPISGDDELLHQVMGNLLSNAIKYSPEGSEVYLGARLEGHQVVFWVRDSGIGIPAESLDKIFELFYRVDGASKRQATGTGLGLALVKRIVDAHHGRVWAESTLGEGSTFYVSLPVARPAGLELG